MANTSEYFVPTCGLFQGNPIASLCFNLVIELLATQLRNNKDIHGLKIKNEELLLAQFADDLGIVLEYNQCTWNQVENEFTVFENISGMVINYEKSLVYRLGSIHKTNAKFYSSKQLHWTDKPFKVLGIMLTNDPAENYNLNYLPLIGKIEIGM